jgi:hypothetical protein
MRFRIIGMDTQFSSAVNSLLVLPIFDFIEDLPCVVTDVAFEPLWKRGHDMEPAGIPNHCDHQFWGLDRVPFSVGHWFPRCEPDALVIRGEIKPRLIEGHDVMPVSGLLGFEHSQ